MFIKHPNSRIAVWVEDSKPSAKETENQEKKQEPEGRGTTEENTPKRKSEKKRK